MSRLIPVLMFDRILRYVGLDLTPAACCPAANAFIAS